MNGLGEINIIEGFYGKNANEHKQSGRFSCKLQVAYFHDWLRGVFAVTVRICNLYLHLAAWGLA